MNQEGVNAAEVFQAELTRPDSLKGACSDIDAVISTVGVTKQKDGLSYMDVDYQANMNLLSEAKKDGVKKFIYVSVLNGENLRQLKICEAKERFVEQLKNSGLAYCVIRPNGFFSDMAEFQAMAKKGRIYLFGNGESKSNPIHGEDLAEVCVDAIEKPGREINIGGPETLTHNEIARTGLCFPGEGSKNFVYSQPGSPCCSQDAQTGHARKGLWSRRILRDRHGHGYGRSGVWKTHPGQFFRRN